MAEEKRDPIAGRNPPVAERPPGHCEKCGRAVLRVQMSIHPQLQVAVEPEPHEDGSVLVYRVGDVTHGKFLSGPEEWAVARSSGLARHLRHGIHCPNPLGLLGTEFEHWNKEPKSSSIDKEETS